MEEQLKQLQTQVAELLEWKRQKTQQQIAYPLDTTSETIIGSAKYEGTGTSALTQSISLSGNAENINVPAAYQDTAILLIGSTRIEVPVIDFL